MNIIVLNGSPKGKVSVTMQYVRYVEQHLPKHTFEVIHVAQQIKKLERQDRAFDQVVERVTEADGVLWAFPLYILHVHGNYKRFIELIWERDVVDAFRGKHAASLSTSIHFFDHTAHNYVHAICDDLGMRYIGSFSADMRDLFEEQVRDRLVTFGREFLRAIAQDVPVAPAFAPLVHRSFEYRPSSATTHINSQGQRIVLVTDADPDQANLCHLVERFQAAFDPPIEVIHLQDVDIKGGCLGCLKCGYDNQCAYVDQDGFIPFYNDKLKPADVIVFAGAMKDRHLSSLWKTYFDRSFFNTHTPSLVGKQFGFIISGPLSQNANMRQILEAYVQFQRSNLVGFVTDEYGESAEIDCLLDNLAERSVRLAKNNYVAPFDFLGVGGMKIFRDDVWGRLRAVFRADHLAFKRKGVYDFPHRDWRARLMNAGLGTLLRIPGFRRIFVKRMKEGMVQPYQKILE